MHGKHEINASFKLRRKCYFFNFDALRIIDIEIIVLRSEFKLKKLHGTFKYRTKLIHGYFISTFPLFMINLFN